MWKKVTFTIPTPIRKRLEKNSDLRESRAYERALIFPGELMFFLGLPRGERLERLHAHMSATEQILASEDQSGQWLDDAARIADRVEVIVDAVIDTTVALKIRFYKKGARRAHYTLSVNVSEDSVIPSGYTVHRKRSSE